MHEFIARATAFVVALQAFFASHPEIAVPLTGALVTLIFKPRTQEQYEAIASRGTTRAGRFFWPRCAALLQLIAAVFPDPVKASKVVGKVLSGKSDPPPPPKGPSVLPLVFLAAFFVTTQEACKEAEAARSHTNAVVVSLADGVKVGDMVCAAIAIEKNDAQLARDCDRARDEAAIALQAAQDKLYAGSLTEQAKFGCEFRAGVEASSRLAELIVAAGGKTPARMADALDVASKLGASVCR